MQILNNRNCHALNQSKVFTYQGKEIKSLFISHKFKKILLQAGLNQKYSFHTLRHTFASRLVQKGVSIYHVAKLLTHSDIRVTQIYAHLTESNLKDAVNKLV